MQRVHEHSSEKNCYICSSGIIFKDQITGPGMSLETKTGNCWRSVSMDSAMMIAKDL